tara:strand:+ start:513 stop:1019 length:507 start_codon:yes stop_codon:yes gene_type:complete
MKKIGNIQNDTWITNTVEQIMSKEGIFRPKHGGIPEGVKGKNEWQKAIDAGYDPNAKYFQMFTKDNLQIDVPNISSCGRQQHWWITKMMPGNFMPMHVDPHTVQQQNADRFWIPLQDWQPGHIFMYEDYVTTDYKKGDIFQYANSSALHGAANIGSTPRVVLQVTLHE